MKIFTLAILTLRLKISSVCIDSF